MNLGRVRRVFPGGNSGLGFYSFYEYIARPDANRIIIIKGGPGVGKSHFMKKIADELLLRGYDVEFHHCSGDVESIDGIYVPAVDLAIMDGTAPHTVDPRTPGAVDEIIHLGDYWDEEGIRRHKSSILRLTAETGFHFRRAYRYLSIAKILREELSGYVREANALDIAGLNRTANQLMKDLFRGASFQHRQPYTRHLFASAITHKGFLNYFDTLFSELRNRVIISGPAGSGRSTLVEKVIDAAQRLGLDLEVYHDVIDPGKVEHIIIPALSTAVINGSPPHDYSGSTGDQHIDTSRFIDRRALETHLLHMKEAQARFDDAIARCVYFLGQAKKLHDQLESYYVPNMRFHEVEVLREKVLDQILQMPGLSVRQPAGKNPVP